MSNVMNIDEQGIYKDLDVLKDCQICPRQCGVNRLKGELGYCKSDANFHISSICIHKGEEPPISGEKGICNVFFSHCNLQCSYCQNHQISFNSSNNTNNIKNLTTIISEICLILDQGIKLVGFVSAGHFIPQMKVIIKALNSKNYFPKIVYNSNAYDRVEELLQMENIVDVYLPDLKYADNNLAKRYSDAENYPSVAFNAIKEMYRQKGSSLIQDEDGLAESGLLIRHLVLPGQIENSQSVLKWIANELSINVSVSLMAQYFPTSLVKHDSKLGRCITEKEFNEVVNSFYDNGLHKGFIQELDSPSNYKPDFSGNQHPFE